MSPPPSDDDPFDLDRFAQAQHDVYDSALAEIRRGRKAGHWMWFVFPQLRGLGVSPTAWRYGLTSLAEARAYLAHSVLGARLRACATAAAEHDGLTATAVFGSPDDQKFRSSMTLFEAADPADPLWARALDLLCGGARDPRTLQMLDDRRRDDGSLG